MKSTLPVIHQAHDFRDADFVGGDVVLDFANTVTGRNGVPRDWLPSYEAFCRWALARGVVDEAECIRLLQDSAKSQGDRALARARDMREAIFRVVSAAAGSQDPEDDDVALITSAWRDAVGASGLTWASGEGLVKTRPWFGSDTIALRIAANFPAWGAELSSSRMRLCEGENCAWVFLDKSKAGRRRWCDMATCGNHEKGERHRLRRNTRATQNA